MQCPVCDEASPLQSVSLESHLKASGCSACEGKWIEGGDYWRWLEQHGDTLPEKEPDEIPLEASDRQLAKLCPTCKRIMLRYKVGHSLDFMLDQCSSCNGIWFDANEWEALKQRNLHDEVHLIFSAPWQSQIRKDEARQLLDSIYTGYFEGDYAKVKEIKAWIEAHPQKENILNYLYNEDPYSLSDGQ